MFYDFSFGKVYLLFILLRRIRLVGGILIVVFLNFFFWYILEIRCCDEYGNGICSESWVGSCCIIMFCWFGNG